MIGFSKKEKTPEDIKDVLEELAAVKKELTVLRQDFDRLLKKSEIFVQKVGIIRYSPFNDVGGDQSFSLAVLNDKNDGVVITSLYNREGNRIYGKSIRNGQSKYILSGEEKEALNRAQNLTLDGAEKENSGGKKK